LKSLLENFDEGNISLKVQLEEVKRIEEVMKIKKMKKE